MLKVGLTGNFGMGKSQVLRMFGALGAYTIDADEIVGELFEDPQVLRRLGQVLGEDIFDEQGALLREKVAEKIFRDESLRMTIEDVLHPLVFARVDEILLGVDAEVAVIEATLIFERSHQGRFDKTVTVFTDEQTALSRLEAEGVPRDHAMGRLLCQMPSEQKIALANYSIDNSGTPETTQEQVAAVYAALIGRSMAGEGPGAPVRGE